MFSTGSVRYCARQRTLSDGMWRVSPLYAVQYVGHTVKSNSTLIAQEFRRPFDCGIIDDGLRNKKPSIQARALSRLVERPRGIRCLNDRCRIAQRGHDAIARWKVRLMNG